MTSNILGATIAIIGTIFASLGNEIISKSQKKIGKEKCAYIFVGNVLFTGILGTSCGIIALAYAPQSVIAPIGGLIILWNILITGNVKRGQIIGCIITIIGIMLVLFCGPQENEIIENKGINVMKNENFKLLTLLYIIIAIIMYIKKGKYESGIIGGVIGGITDVYVKASLQYYLEKEEEDGIKNEIEYMLIIRAITLAIIQLGLINKALLTYPVNIIVPIYTISLMICSTISGGIAFNEFKNVTYIMYIGFFIGIILCTNAVIYLSTFIIIKEEEEEEEEEKKEKNEKKENCHVI